MFFPRKFINCIILVKIASTVRLNAVSNSEHA